MPPVSSACGAGPAEGYRGDTAPALADVRRWLADQWRVVLVTEGHGPAQRLAEMLRARRPRRPARRPGRPARARRTARHDRVSSTTGFTWEAARLAVICEADLAGPADRRPGTPGGCPAAWRGGSTRSQLTPGDYVRARAARRRAATWR